jgi:transposase
MYKEISDSFWSMVEPLFEPFKRTHPGGSAPLPTRSILNGLFYFLKTGCQWDMIPKCYGSKTTIHEHFQKWTRAGIFHKIFEMVTKDYDEFKGIQWQWQSMDGSLVQAPTRQTGGSGAVKEGLGRNPTDRGRQGTKLHLLVDQNGIPIGVKIVGANVHDSRLVSSTLETLIIERQDSTEEDPQNLCLDKGYSYKRVEKETRAHNYQPHIKRIGEEKFDQADQKTHPARRWVVERTLAWFKGFRALRTRYVCKGENYLAIVHFAAALINFRAAHPKQIWA